MRQFILVAALIYVQLTQAQTNFKSGFIINNVGDTIQGEINFNWVTKAGELTFRTAANNEQRLTPSNLKGFSIENGDYYQSLTVDVDVSPTNPDQLLELGEDQFEEQSFFAKVLLLGSAHLFQSFDQERGRYHYFIENAQTLNPIELISGRRTIPTNQGASLQNASVAYKKLDKYKGQLAYLLGDCADVQSSIRSMNQLTESTAKSIIEKYNNCNDNTVSYRQSSSLKKLKINLGILAGVQWLKVNHESSQAESAALAHNLGLKLILNINDRKNLKLALTALHRQYNFNEQNTKESTWRLTPTSDISQTTTTTEIDKHNWQQLTFILEAQYAIGIGSNKILLNAGPGVSFAYNGTSTLTRDSFRISRPSNEISESFGISDYTRDDRDRQFLLNFGIGYQWKRFIGSIDYELAGAMIKLNTENT